MDNKVQITMENLKKNNIDAYYCETSAEAKELVKSLINKGDVISSGGSMTLKETGIIDVIKSNDYKYLDRNAPNLTADEKQNIERDVYKADVYFASNNAVTESGYLYNVDGNSNRVSAILYGPKSVILVTGVNKIVKNIDEAIMRVKNIAAPKNTVRLDMGTYCSKTGKCVSLNNENSEMCDGCHSEGRVCCNFVLCGHQRHKNRIKVIFINEKLGY